jgi:hypothetical protein
MLPTVIGKRLALGPVSEVVPVAPRPDVRAPLVMERLRPEVVTPELRSHAEQLGFRLARLPAPWQRLVDAQFTAVENHFIFERFVGVTMRDLSLGLRKSRRVLPLDVLRTLIERACDAFEDISQVPPLPAPTPWQWLGVTDRSIGLSLDGRWCFAVGALNHWLIELGPSDEWGSVEETYLPHDTLSFLSPEATAAREETPASFVTRAALLSWQLCTGGFHPFRGRPHEMASDFLRFAHGEVRVPLTVHPQLPLAAIEVLQRGIAWAQHRFEHLGAFRQALAAAWPVSAASNERTLQVVASVAWTSLERELETLKREPLLPIQWDGVWTATQSPEAGIAVLQDQLLDRLEPLDVLPKRAELPVTAGPLPEPPPPPTSTREVPAIAPALPPAPRPVLVAEPGGFVTRAWRRVVAFFRR